MAYPFPGFGTFMFQRSEWPLFGTDTGWNRELSVAQARPLGSSRDSVVTLAAGSQVRSFECLLTPTRYAELLALLNTTATFVDWERPVPNSQSAFLKTVTQSEWLRSANPDDTGTRKRIRTRVELVGQG